MKAVTDSLITYFPPDNSRTDISGAAFVTAIVITILAVLSGLVYIILMIKGGTYIFGAPICKVGRDKFIHDIKTRFKDGNYKDYAEAAVSYLNDITNRIVTKAIGLLQYNAVIFALTYLISYHYSIDTLKFPQNVLLFTSIVCSIMSTSLVILVMFTHWRKCYEDPWVDVEESAKLCMMRSFMITGSLIAGGAAAVCDMVFYVYTT